MAITRTIEIDAPIERVFDLVDKPENLRRWIDGLEETTYLDEPDPASPVGTRFKQRIREGGRVAEYEGEVTAYEKPRHLGVRIGNTRFEMDVDYRFSERGDGVRLDYTATAIPTSAIASVMNVLFGWLGTRIARKQLAKLKLVAESGA